MMRILEIYDSLQIYFLYVNIWTAFTITNRFDEKFALFSLSQSIIYCAEIIYTLFLYEELRKTSERVHEIVFKIPVINYAGSLSKDIVFSLIHTYIRI